MRFLYLFVGLSFSTAAFAESVNVQLFRSPFNLNYGMVESAITDSMPWDEDAPEPRAFFSANYNYVKSPLVVINTNTNTRTKVVVDNVHTTDLALGYFLSPGVSVYGQLPLHLSTMGAETNHFGIGDGRTAAKISLTDRAAPLSFSLMPELTFPTGDRTRFLSDDSFGAGMLLLAENDFGNFRLTGNLGYRYANAARVRGIDYRNRIPLAIGAAIPLTRKLLLNGEVSGSLSLPTSQQQNPSEFYLGLNYHPKRHLATIVGASVGTFDRENSLDYRLQAAVRMYFGESPVAAPVTAVAAPAPAPKARIVDDRIEITEEIQFEHNKDRLLNSSRLVLDAVAAIILKHGDTMKWVEVEGHTSLIGSEDYNDRLSMRRAKAVVDYLVKMQGVPARLLVPKGYGEQRPKYLPGKATDEELERNRRVEFKVVR